jgi:dihydrofolate synthase / folylpolyglutamate synthase
LTAREYLRSRSWLGQKFGLLTMQKLVRALDHPERSFKTVLIAGTNGKGSVSAYLDAALRGAALRTGCYTSPHLIDIRERITVSGKQISNTAFERHVLAVRDCAQRLLRKGIIRAHPNHFEILTAAAFLHFREKQVEIAVLEVGLGGRLDATNVADPLVSAIVSIDFDHEEFLGSTLAAIAKEKAGVARRHRSLVLGPMAREAFDSIRSSARARGAHVIHAMDGVRVRREGEDLEVKTPRAMYAKVRPLRGAHQRTNIVVAIRTLEALRASGLDVDLQAGVHAMSGASWPGRLERFDGRPAFLLDGAHNPAGAAALAAYLTEKGGSHVLVFGAMRDKHIREMAAHLFPLPRLIVATRVRMKRAATTAQLAQIASEAGVRVAEEPSLVSALSFAGRSAKPRETVVVAGSLYLVGASRRWLLKRARRS